MSCRMGGAFDRREAERPSSSHRKHGEDDGFVNILPARAYVVAAEVGIVFGCLALLVYTSGWPEEAIRAIQSGVSELASPVRQTKEYRAAMAGYRAAHPACEWCGRRDRIEIHHLLPVMQSASAAASSTNSMALCERDHRAIGHPTGTTKYCANIRELIAARKILP